jgi:hypothetical protein
MMDSQGALSMGLWWRSCEVEGCRLLLLATGSGRKESKCQALLSLPGRLTFFGAANHGSCRFFCSHSMYSKLLASVSSTFRHNLAMSEAEMDMSIPVCSWNCPAVAERAFRAFEEHHASNKPSYEKKENLHQLCQENPTRRTQSCWFFKS